MDDHRQYKRRHHPSDQQTQTRLLAQPVLPYLRLPSLLVRAPRGRIDVLNNSRNVEERPSGEGQRDAGPVLEGDVVDQSADEVDEKVR